MQGLSVQMICFLTLPRNPSSFAKSFIFASIDGKPAPRKAHFVGVGRRTGEVSTFVQFRTNFSSFDRHRLRTFNSHGQS
ncbi:hypothetical protein ACLKMY_36410, partial [Paraburkholderia mimosarum]|uniref:hypothetical protein n=1 Tax=Paraburkholderia mimosarum TaxID=312026 RepID=UPI001C3F458B